MKRNLIALAALGLFALGCGESPTSTTQDTAGLDATPEFAARGPLVHHVSVGGADVCEALGLPTGCDANLSLTASEGADGSVSGQWQDTFAGGVPIHVTIDCLHVVGNEAWVSGVVTGPVGGGTPVIMRVADNGTSKNDAPDQLSFLNIGDLGGCQNAPDLQLFDLTNGQVTVW